MRFSLNDYVVRPIVILTKINKLKVWLNETQKISKLFTYADAKNTYYLTVLILLPHTLASRRIQRRLLNCIELIFCFNKLSISPSALNPRSIG